MPKSSSNTNHICSSECYLNRKIIFSPGILKFSLIPVGKSVFSGTVLEKFSNSGSFVGISKFLGTSTGGKAGNQKKMTETFFVGFYNI